MICTDCKNKCNEYLSSFISDKANWEWTRKMDKCELDKIVDNMDFIDSPGYARFIMPTADELVEQERWEKLSSTEKELESVRNKYTNGKYTTEEYLYAVDCILSYALEDGDITIEEEERLQSKFNL